MQVGQRALPAGREPPDGQHGTSIRSHTLLVAS